MRLYSDVDPSLGALIRQIRHIKGMSQMKLAEKLGISYQQVQKYESGASQLTIARLKQMAEALGVPTHIFLKKAAGVAESGGGVLSKDEVKLVGLYRRIEEKPLRDGYMRMLKSLAGKKERTGRK